MNLRHTSLLPGVGRVASPKEFGQNPDSSSSIDITDVDEKNEVDIESQMKSGSDYEATEEERNSASRDEGINLTLHRGKKTAITLVRQKDESVSSTDKKTARSASARHSDVWRPY